MRPCNTKNGRKTITRLRALIYAKTIFIACLFSVLSINSLSKNPFALSCFMQISIYYRAHRSKQARKNQRGQISVLDALLARSYRVSWKIVATPCTSKDNFVCFNPLFKPTFSSYRKTLEV